MNASLFGSNDQLDIAFLDEAYANDAETASYVFQMYLDDLPINLNLLRDSIENKDIERFRQLIHKQKPGFSYVGLTTITSKLQELQMKCNTVEDLNSFKVEINEVIEDIESSTIPVVKTLTHLKQVKRA
jgi:hypothetical protein